MTKKGHFITLTPEKLTQLGSDEDTIFEVCSIEEDKISVLDTKRFGPLKNISVNDIVRIKINSELAGKIGLQLNIAADIMFKDRKLKPKRNPFESFVITAEQIKLDISGLTYVNEVQDLLVNKSNEKLVIL